MALYLLDTNVFADLSNTTPNRGVLRVFESRSQRCVTSSIVLHELWFGIERLPQSKRRDNLERFMTDVVAPIRVLPYGRRAARRHARERARLEGLGRPASFADAQIAAVALTHDCVMVTANPSHFESFEGLRVEDWRS